MNNVITLILIVSNAITCIVIGSNVNFCFKLDDSNRLSGRRKTSFSGGSGVEMTPKLQEALAQNTKSDQWR